MTITKKLKMKKYIHILILVFGITTCFAQTEYAITSNSGTPSSRYNLEANKNYSIHLSVFIDGNSSLKGFKTTFDDLHELTWDLTKFEKNKWIELKHNFTTTSQMVEPTLKIDMINEGATGFGNGIFYVDDIRIYDTSSLSLEDLEARVQILPNPVKNHLIIKNISNNSKVNIYNVLGSSFFAKLNSTGNDSYTINMSNLPKGVYFLRIKEDDKILTKKILKQ